MIVSAGGERLRAIALRVEELMDKNEAALLRALAVLLETEPPPLVVLADGAAALEAAADELRGLSTEDGDWMIDELMGLWREAAELIRGANKS